MLFLKSAILASLFFSFLQASTEKIEVLRLHSIQQQADYKKVAHTLKQFVRDKGHKKQNTFYLSKVKTERFTNQYIKGRINEYAYAYWVENQALILLTFPLTDYDNWFQAHHYTDLKTDVVPKGSVENLGSYLVTDDWVKKQIRACKKGSKITLIKNFPEQRQSSSDCNGVGPTVVQSLRLQTAR